MNKKILIFFLSISWIGVYANFDYQLEIKNSKNQFCEYQYSIIKTKNYNWNPVDNSKEILQHYPIRTPFSIKDTVCQTPLLFKKIYTSESNLKATDHLLYSPDNIFVFNKFAPIVFILNPKKNQIITQLYLPNASEIHSFKISKDGSFYTSYLKKDSSNICFEKWNLYRYQQLKNKCFSTPRNETSNILFEKEDVFFLYQNSNGSLTKVNAETETSNLVYNLKELNL